VEVGTEGAELLLQWEMLWHLLLVLLLRRERWELVWHSVVVVVGENERVAWVEYQLQQS